MWCRSDTAWKKNEKRIMAESAKYNNMPDELDNVLPTGRKRTRFDQLAADDSGSITDSPAKKRFVVSEGFTSSDDAAEGV